HRRVWTVLRNPAGLLLGPLQVGPQILIGLSFLRAMPGRVEAVQCCVTERRCQRVGRYDHPDQRRRSRLRPDLVSNCGEKEERYQRLQTVCGRRGGSIDLAVEPGTSKAEAKTP